MGREKDVNWLTGFRIMSYEEWTQIYPSSKYLELKGKFWGQYWHASRCDIPIPYSNSLPLKFNIEGYWVGCTKLCSTRNDVLSEFAETLREKLLPHLNPQSIKKSSSVE